MAKNKNKEFSKKMRPGIVARRLGENSTNQQKVKPITKRASYNRNSW
jgi:hypothetical protein